MSAESLLEQFGYVAVFVGTFLEGEATLIAAGFFAASGHLSLPLVTVVAFAGAYGGNLFWFWLGRVHGVRLLDRFPRMKRHFGKGIRVFERYGASAILITQWIYGLRITCAVIIGMSKIGLVKFVVYEALSCALWAVVITFAGFYFGRAIQALLGRVEHLEKYALVVIAVGALGFWLYHRWKEKREEGET
jgi:membrane protein DedA with SNARE-associated domain